MIELSNSQLVFRFPEVHPDAVCRIELQRTLRIPDDNRDYPLPPGLGRFSLDHVDDYVNRVPETWARHGGVFLPLSQAEALWINFHGSCPDTPSPWFSWDGLPLPHLTRVWGLAPSCSPMPYSASARPAR